MKPIYDEHSLINYLAERYFNEKQQAIFRYLKRIYSCEDMAFIGTLADEYCFSPQISLQEAVECFIKNNGINETEFEDYLE